MAPRETAIISPNPRQRSDPLTTSDIFSIIAHPPPKRTSFFSLAGSVHESFRMRAHEPFVQLAGGRLQARGRRTDDREQRTEARGQESGVRDQEAKGLSDMATYFRLG